MNLARLFSYTVRVEAENLYLKKVLEAEQQRNSELIDAFVFNRLPQRLASSAETASQNLNKSDADEPFKSTTDVLMDKALQAETIGDRDYDQTLEWQGKLQSADPLTRAEMLAEFEYWEKK